MQESLGDPCDTRRLYLHFLCRTGWETEKAKAWDRLDLWMVDKSGRPMWADGGGPKGAHAFLPCGEKVAWSEVDSKIQR